MRRDYCTYFDHRYLARGLALYRSLERHADDFRLYVLCLTPEASSALASLNLEHVRLVDLADLEAFDPELAATRPTRSAVEYYFTCTPAWMRFVFSRHPAVETLTYLDADLFFFSSPEPLFSEWGDGAVAIVPHRFPPALRDREIFGRFNVGWVSFARGEPGLSCLDRWRGRCLEWCYDRVEPDRFADQKYLDDWPEHESGVVVLGHPGADLAPWNLEAHALTPTGESELLVDGRQLVFFHAQGFEYSRGGSFDPHLEEYGVESTELIVERIYHPYLSALLAAEEALDLVREPVGTVEPLRPRPGGSVGPGIPPAPRSLGSARVAWPRISLVTPTLNQAPFLEAALRSALDQGYPNLEYIVVDGGSEDGSREILERHSHGLSYWVSEPDRGQAHALNKGFARATGEILGWLNADDLLLPGSLFLAGELFAEFPDVAWLTSRATALDPMGRIVDSMPQLPWTRSRFLDRTDQFIQQESTFWRRTLWDAAGGFVSEEHLACDFELWARFFRQAGLHQTRGAIGAFRTRPGQESRGQRPRYLAEVEQIVARERSIKIERRDEHAETLYELAFNPESWRFERVEAASPRGSAARDFDIRIARLESALELSERDRTARLDAIGELDRAVAGRDAAIERFEEALRATEDALDGRVRAIEKYEEALAGRDQAIAAYRSALEGRDAAIRALEAELAGMRASASWRVTRPLRRILERVSRFRRLQA